jgi:pyruvate/2-oxoglutarate dehydrogenase complex dihydrolipoamide acyltransferase (E2) component
MQDVQVARHPLRDDTLVPDDYKGGTTTISNLGMQGDIEFSAIGRRMSGGLGRMTAPLSESNRSQMPVSVTVVFASLTSARSARRCDTERPCRRTYQPGDRSWSRPSASQRGQSLYQ